MEVKKAKEIIKKQEEKELKEFREELEKLLKEYNMRMQIVPHISINGQEPSISIIKNEQQ